MHFILGSLLDKFGCKPFLILNSFGQLIGDVGIMINFAFIEQLPLEFFYIETLYGLFGGMPVWYLSNCYLCDNYVSQWWVDLGNEFSWLFTNRLSATR